jgi:hypothetical protein
MRIATPTDADVRAIAAETAADPRTVIRRLAGLPVRASIARSLDRAIAERLGTAAPSSPPPRAA